MRLANRIESNRNFFARIGMLYWRVRWGSVQGVKCPSRGRGARPEPLAIRDCCRMLHDSFMIRALLLRLCETNFADDVSSATNDAVSPAQQFFLVFLRVWWRVVWQQRGLGIGLYTCCTRLHTGGTTSGELKRASCYTSRPAS